MSMESSKSARPPRIGVIDALRGLACVFMITWHCADAWLLPGLRESASFSLTRIIGGFAAPLFMWLAGLSSALTTPLQPSTKQTSTSLIRAAWVVVVGYGLKLLAWTIDHGAITDRVNWTTMYVAFPSIFALGWATREARLERARGLAFIAGFAGLLFAYSHLEGTTRAPNVLARLDVLHGIGAALFVTTLLLAGLGRIVRTESQRALVLVCLAILVALITPHWIGGSLAPLPTRIADYIARLREPFAESGARFPLFPWLGHALSGAAFGTLFRSAKKDLGETELPLVTRIWVPVVVALCVACVVYEGGFVAPLILGRFESLRALLRLMFYGSLAVGLSALLAWIGPKSKAFYNALRAMGQSSLLVYGAHLEFAYGLAGLPVQRLIGWPLYFVGIALLTLLMLALVHVVERFEKHFSKRTKAA